MTEPSDPYPWRPEAVRQLREQGRFAEADAILNAPLVWMPEEKTLEQWMALGTYLVASAQRDLGVSATDVEEEPSED